MFFSHYLWNAGIKMAELFSQENDLKWSVEGKRGLELGAWCRRAGVQNCSWNMVSVSVG